jgi:putative ABC transport system permease protein
MRTQFKKVMGDLKADWAKNLTLALAIAIGVFGVGAVLGAYAVLNREMDRNYSGTHPAHATIVADRGIEKSVEENVKGVPGVLDAETHAIIVARMRVEGDWYRLLLFVIKDFDAMKMNTFTPLSGAWPPPDGTMLVERGAVALMRAGEGGSVEAKLAEGEIKQLPISGVVHDPTLAPARQEQTGYAYITPATLRMLGGNGELDRLRIATTASTVSQVERIASLAGDALKRGGYKVHEIQVPPIGRHPHNGQMNAILALLGLFALLMLSLSAVLVANAMSSLMVKQVRQIGVMKTIGASSLQIAGVYFLMIAITAGAGSAVAAPPSVYAARAYADIVGGLLNFTIFDHTVPMWVLAIQLSAGILIPLIVAVRTVMRGSRITIREAINDYGVRADTVNSKRFERIISGIRLKGSLFTLSLRNLFRNHARLAVALALLASAGAIFISALNMSEAWEVQLGKISAQRHYDLEVRLSKPVNPLELAGKINRLGGIKRVEAWGIAPTSFTSSGQFAITRTYPDTGHGSFAMLGVPDATRAVDLPLLQGKWLTPGRDDETVLNHMALAQKPDVKPGDDILLSIEGVAGKWRVAGIVEDIGSPATAYVSMAGFARVAGSAGTANMFRVTLEETDPALVLAKTRQLEDALYRAKAPVSLTMPTGILRNAVAEHMAILVGILLAMATLMGVAGAVGLMSTISISIMERTRELGVMRAIGATPETILRLLIAKGLLIGTLSIPIAIMLSLPLSLFIGRLIGNMAFRTPLPLVVSHPALASWVVLVVVGSLIATAWPALRAGRKEVREALSYE